MSPIVDPLGPNCDRMLACYRHFLSVIVAVIREDGALVDCNAGFRRLLEKRSSPPSNNVVDFFVLPRFDQLVSTISGQDGIVHTGVLNVGDVTTACCSLTGAMYRTGQNLILVAEFDVAEMETLNAQILQLNEELAGVQRELVRHKRHLEELVAARTLSLSIAKEAAEAANVAKSNFLANMSHEMRTPLHQITGLLQLIRREPLTPKQLDRMDKLDTSSQRLLGIIDMILQLTDIESKKLNATVEPLDIQKLLNGIISKYQSEAAAKNLALTLDAAGIPSNLVGDAKLVEQAISNYMSNAIRFTETGRVSVRVKLIEEDAASALLRFEVEDTGIGIAPEVLPRLFTIFEQADNSSTRKYGGVGLGLAMTKKLAQIMGGDTGVENTTGQGSNFWFTVRVGRPASTDY